LFSSGGVAAALDPVCDLSGAEDPALQHRLEDLLGQMKLTRPVEDGELALTLLILSDPEHPRLAQVNGSRMVYAASLPKIAILLGAAVAIDEGRLQPDGAVLEDINEMIRHSCNECANRVIELVGEEELLQILQSPRYAFYDDEEGGLWLGKLFGQAPAWRRDPLHNLSHGATTFQTARFYCGVERGTLVSPEQSRLMLDALSNPGINHKFVKGLQRYQDIDVFRKSGTWQKFHADSALVHSGNQVYVMVGLAHGQDAADWLEELAAPLHELAISPPVRTVSENTPTAPTDD
jgi:beta-lactamase class A